MLGNRVRHLLAEMDARRHVIRGGRLHKRELLRSINAHMTQSYTRSSLASTDAGFNTAVALIK